MILGKLLMSLCLILLTCKLEVVIALTFPKVFVRINLSVFIKGIEECLEHDKYYKNALLFYC
jgi:hypothetical protein